MTLWFIGLAVHAGWWLFSELVERSVRKTLEREYRRRLAENVDSYDDYLRARAERLAAQHDDGEPLDLEDALADPKAKRKRM